VRLIAVDELPAGTRAKVKIRYNSPGCPAVLEPVPNNRIRVSFDVPVRAVTPGQSAVFYAGAEVLGGAIIERSLSKSELQADPTSL
jgi:tRNA-specific 2-thiouridylase